MAVLVCYGVAQIVVASPSEDKKVQLLTQVCHSLADNPG